MIHCFNSLPNFSSVEFSTMRRIEVLYTPNNFTRSGRERQNVDKIFIKDPAVLSWLCYYSLRLFGGIEKIPSDLPVFVKNKADFTREVSRVQQFVKEVMEDKPEYLCNDIYTLDDLYVVFKYWYKSNIREKGDPPKFEQFLKQAADYIESHVPEWSIMIPKKGEKRVQKKVSMKAAIGKPENFVYEYRKEFAENNDPFLSFRSEAVKAGSNRDKIGKGNITRRDILQNWDYLSDMSIEELCTLETRFKRGKPCDKVIFRNQDYLGTGKFYHSSLRGYRSTKDGTLTRS